MPNMYEDFSQDLRTVGDLIDFLSRFDRDMRVSVSSDKYPEDASGLIGAGYIETGNPDHPYPNYVLIDSEWSRDAFNAAQERIGNTPARLTQS